MLRVVAHDRFAHHGSRSGYLRILPYLAESAEISVIHLANAPHGLRTVSEWWSSRNATADCDAELHIYPEQTLFPRMADKPVVAVCHQPPQSYLSWLPRRALVRQALRRAQIVIALGPNQAKGLKAVNPTVHFVPHGVDTHWFSPGPTRAEDGRYLIVRGWLRDPREQAALADAARKLGGRVVEIGQGTPRLSDHGYRAALRACTAVLLWITNGVASNAVLEASSCGKAVLGRLSADLQSYVSEVNREILSRPVEAQLTTGAEELALAGNQNRALAVSEHSWPDVAARLLSVVAQHVT